MYERFYGFLAPPFSLLPDADFLYPGARHRRALNHLEYGLVSQAGFIVLTGEVGAGKTTVVRRFLKNAGPGLAVGLITNPSPSLGRLFGWIAMAFDLKVPGAPDDAKIYHALVAFLLEQYAQGKRTVLVIDEAQNLGPATLEDLRMLSNVNNEKDQLLQIVLVGQPELLDMLNQPQLRQFAQRIAVHCHLDPLSAKETSAYIRHRLSVAGGAPALFDDKACRMVHRYSGGVPRLINLLCDQALVYGFSEDRETITGDMVAAVAQDRARGGLSPFKNLTRGGQAA